MTLNNTVNNWAMEIESFKIKFVHIAGKDNVLTDTLSRLIDIDPDVELQPELKDYEFGHYAFETLPKAKGKMVHEIITSLDGVNVCEINITYDNSENSPYSVKLPLSNEKFSCLQDKDLKVRQLKQTVIQGQYTQFYFIKKGVLYRSVVDNGHKFEAAVVPEDLIHTVLHLGHNQSGHNGYQRTYATIKHVYYCPTCAKQRVQKRQFEKQIFELGVQPMEFICIDLIGEFYPPSSKGNRYALTAVCMLTGFTFCIPIKNKTAQEVVTAWRNHISFLFGVCRKLLTDNGTEFKNDLFSQVAEQLGVERKIYTPPYRPQSNGRIEGFHNFLKSCLEKHISKNREWDDVVIGTVYPNIPLSSASLHGHPRSSLGASLGVCMSTTAYGNLSTMSSVWPIGTFRLNLRPRPLSI